MEFVRFHQLYNVIGFAVDRAYKTCSEWHDLPVYELENLQQQCPEQHYSLFIAVMWNHLNAERKSLYLRCKEMGFHLANLISPTAIIRGNICGDNCWVHDYAVIQNNAVIQADTFIMAYSLVGPAVQLGEHCFLAVRSLVAGGSRVGDQTFIGLSSTVFDDTTIGRKCIVGACCAVKRNLPDFTRCVTASDACVMKQYTEDEVENKLVSAFNKR